MFESAHQIFFILGLLGFLGAHLLYIASLRADIDLYHLKSFKGVFGVVLMLGLLVLVTTYFEAKGNANYQGLLRLAVPIYSIVLGSLVVCSANQKTSSNTGGVLLFSGALLFMLSDMLIALGAFSSSINFMGVGFRSALIMFTYILAQFLIVRGLLAKRKTHPCSFRIMIQYKDKQFNTPNDYFRHLLEVNNMPDVLSSFKEETIEVEGERLHLRTLTANANRPTVVFYQELLHMLCAMRSFFICCMRGASMLLELTLGDTARAEEKGETIL